MITTFKERKKRVAFISVRHHQQYTEVIFKLRDSLESYALCWKNVQLKNTDFRSAIW